MKYKDIFKNIWFWAFTIIYFIIQIVIIESAYGKLYFATVLGVFLGSFLFSLLIYSIGFIIGRLIKKVTKR